MDMEKSSRINRRGFLKTVAAAGAVGLGARGAAASQKRTLVYKPGVYTAKAAGISSDRDGHLRQGPHHGRRDRRRG